MTQPRAVQQIADTHTSTTAGSQHPPDGVLEPIARTIQPLLTPERYQNPLPDLADPLLRRTRPLNRGNSARHAVPEMAAGYTPSLGSTLARAGVANGVNIVISASRCGGGPYSAS